MNPYLILGLITAYFAVLFTISVITAKNADSSAFFIGNRQSPWYMVAFGMIGTSLSGVTFISVPGQVGVTQFGYFQLILGQLLGYLVIATVLMPLYYRLNLISIYTYLQQRFGWFSYKTGAWFFLLSRSLGSSARFYLVVGVLQFAVFDKLNVPFFATALIAICLVWAYTFKGGIKTIIWTDTLQTVFMLASVGISIYLVANTLGLSLPALVNKVSTGTNGQMFFWDPKSPINFWKQFLAGASIAIVMTGLDQDMMQKNLTCRNIGEAQKNMFWFSITLLLVNFMFLVLGASLYLYAESKGIAIPANRDTLFPMLALEYFTPFAGLVFVCGIIASTYASTDSALTALTTSFCIDILGFTNRTEGEREKLRFRTHIGFSILFVVLVLLFRYYNSQSLIITIFTMAGYTYGPLLGLYAFGLFTKNPVRDKWVPVLCLVSPVMCYILKENSEAWFNGYKFGFELLIINGAITFAGMWVLSLGFNKTKHTPAPVAFK